MEIKFQPKTQPIQKPPIFLKPTKPYDTLVADIMIDDWQKKHMDESSIEVFIKEELARKIAEKLIEDNYVNIKTEHNIELLSTRYRGELKVIK